MKILPRPYKIETKDGQFEFNANTHIICPVAIVEKELKFLDFESGKENKIEFAIGDTEFDYEMTISENIAVKSKTEDGLFHAAMSLKQLIFDGYKDGKSCIKNCILYDKARYGYRGFMLDIVRHFFDKDTILGIIDVLALAKFNVLHLHLSDNQGYRLESEVFPVLNEKGNYRKGTRGDGIPVSGYLKKSEVKEIVEYARERYIEVIPEIDLPGHTVAILAAMPEMGCTGEQFDVAERFGIDARIICAGREENYAIIEKLLAEVAEMFPSKKFHIGGDEVPKSQWCECEKCKAKVEKEGLKSFEQLQGYFTNRVVNMLKSLDKTPVVWNEAIYSGMLDNDAICEYWQDGKKAERVAKAAKNGRKVIFTKFRPYYLDYPYGMTPLKATYMCNPSYLFDDEGAKNIIGVECPLWTEYVADVDRLYYQAFPRAFAVAEAGWSTNEKDYKDFVERLENVLAIMQVYDKTFADVKEANPNFVKGGLKVAKFFLNALDVDAIKSAKNANNAKQGRKE